MNLFKKIPKNIKIVLISFGLLFVIYLFIAYLLPLSLKKLSTSTIIYDTNDIKIGELIYDNKIRHEEIKFDEIPDFYKKSLITLEDKSFYTNNGISLVGIVRSTINNIKAGKIIEGGSTLSSQLIRNNLWLNNDRNIWRKVLEFSYAIRLNKLYSKNEILTKYVNNIYFGYLNYGLKSASIYYFAKDPNSLTLAEQIALLSIPKNTNNYDPYKKQNNFKKRFLLITETLFKNNIISKEEKELIENEKLTFNQDHKNKLPYITDFIKQEIESNSIIPNEENSFLSSGAERSGVEGSFNNNKNLLNSGSPSFNTTIDYNLTKKIEEIGENTIYDLSWKHVTDYGVIIVDKKTSDLKVMIGGINYYKKEGQVNSTLALRQPGSTIKPFTYLLAFTKYGIKPNDTILDLPISYKTSEGYSYEPKNYSTTFKGEVSVADALAQSINVPAVKLLEKVGVKNLLYFLKKLGITSLDQDEDFYGLALTLGDGEVSLYELVQAYSIFANNGEICEINYSKDTEKNCEKIVDSKYTDDINYILSNRNFKLPSYPVNSALDFPNRNVFVKTGTSRNFRDNWTVGYTDNYIVGVWAGNKDASNMKGVSGATGAGEIFGRIIREIEPEKNQKNDSIQKINTKEFLEITSPLNGVKYEIDPYKSIKNQKIKLNFSTNISYDKFFWFLDNKKIEDNFIEISVGSHILKLDLIRDGEIIKENIVNFEVK